MRTSADRTARLGGLLKDFDAAAATQAAQAAQAPRRGGGAGGGSDDGSGTAADDNDNDDDDDDDGLAAAPDPAGTPVLGHVSPLDPGGIGFTGPGFLLRIVAAAQSFFFLSLVLPPMVDTRAPPPCAFASIPPRSSCFNV